MAESKKASKISEAVKFWFSVLFIIGIFIWIWELFKPLKRKRLWRHYMRSDHFCDCFPGDNLPSYEVENRIKDIIELYNGEHSIIGNEILKPGIGFLGRVRLYCEYSYRPAEFCTECGKHLTQGSLIRIENVMQKSLFNEMVQNCEQYWRKFYNKIYQRYKFVMNKQQVIFELKKISDNPTQNIENLYKLAHKSLATIEAIEKGVKYDKFGNIVLETFKKEGKEEDIVKEYLRR
jgi:rRNA-processing protein FCF1